MMHVTVNGGPMSALDAAHKRGIPATVYAVQNLSNQTVLDVPYQKRRLVYDWWFEKDRRTGTESGDIASFG